MKKSFAIRTSRVVAALISLFAASSVQAKALNSTQAKSHPISLTPRVLLWGGNNVSSSLDVILWGGGNVGNDKEVAAEMSRFLGVITSPIGTGGLPYTANVILWGGGNVGNGKADTDDSTVTAQDAEPSGETCVILWGGGNVGN